MEGAIMAATAAALSTLVQAREPAFVLKQATNYGNNSASSIETTVLEAMCTEAIEWFGIEFETYDPDNFPWHYTAAKFKALQLLFARAQMMEKASEYEEKLRPYMQKLRTARSVGARSNQSFANNASGSRAPLSDEAWKGISTDVTGGAVDY